MLSAIDATPLTRHQKLRLYKHGVCPQLSWPLHVQTFPTSWLEQVLQPMATKALKSWAGLARHSNSSVLFLSVKRGGLALPSLSGVHRELQASKMVQLVLSRDPGVRKVANLHLLEEKKSKRIKFKPAILVDSIRRQDLPRSCQALRRSVKSLLDEEEDDLQH